METLPNRGQENTKSAEEWARNVNLDIVTYIKRIIEEARNKKKEEGKGGGGEKKGKKENKVKKQEKEKGIKQKGKVEKKEKKGKRKKIPKKIREIVLKRDGYACVYCGESYNMEIHHIIQVKDGGTNDPSNLKTYCENCHRTYHSSSRKNS